MNPQPAPTSDICRECGCTLEEHDDQTTFVTKKVPASARDISSAPAKSNHCPRCDGLRLYFGKGEHISPGYHPCRCVLCPKCNGKGTVIGVWKTVEELNASIPTICPKCGGTGFPEEARHTQAAGDSPHPLAVSAQISIEMTNSPTPRTDAVAEEIERTMRAISSIESLHGQMVHGMRLMSKNARTLERELTASQEEARKSAKLAIELGKEGGALAARVKELELSHKWTYCPECGSETIHHKEGDHKQCGECYQEWFSDIDYSGVVRKHLAGKYSDKDARIKRLEENQDMLTAQNQALREDLEYVCQCFEAAEAEGLSDKVARSDEDHPGGLPDLITRRLMFAWHKAKEALSTAPEGEKTDREPDGDRCESGCDAPVTHHDSEGVPLCEEYWKSAVEEAKADQGGKVGS